MADGKIDLEKIRAYLKASGNPYASLSILEDSEKSDHQEASDDKKHQYLKKMENPYAHHAIFSDAPGIAPSSYARQHKINRPKGSVTLSKKDFRENCNRILSQYVPSEEGKALRAHYRDFVTRNELRPPNERFRIVELLSKYDLSGTENYRPHFNREKNLLTNAKLQAIERTIDLKK